MYFGISEAARRLRVHPDSIARWERQGRISPTRDINGRRIFTDRDVELMEQMRPMSPRQPFKSAS